MIRNYFFVLIALPAVASRIEIVLIERVEVMS
jgi:hypothetical protein